MTESSLGRRSVAVRVPATSANLGSGFDTAGLALAFYNEVRLRAADRDHVTVHGEGEGEIGLGDENFVLKAAHALFEEARCLRPSFCVELRNNIPLGRGLGSSAAASVGGLCAANALLDAPLTRDRLFELAVSIEGHGDNVAAALYGGFTLYVKAQGLCAPVRLSVSHHLRCVLFVPDERVPTSSARAVLPDMVPRSDATYNVGRAALLVAALHGGQISALKVAMEDRLHQTYRAALYPAAGPLIAAALSAGAAGSAVSGAGPTVLAIAETYERVPGIEAALRGTAQALHLAGRTMIVGLDGRGARVLQRRGDS